jgi:hypothetical protein
MLDQTLLGLLSNIEGDSIVLPAMQRPFVWKDDRIYRLIDSLLRGFPIGAVMLWKTNTLQRYRRLTRDIDTDVPQIFNFETSSDSSRYMVLDGQQRLTSLFVAFKGTYNHKRLYIDVLSGDSTDKDPGDVYFDCRFLVESEAKALNEAASRNGRRHFMPVHELILIKPVRAAIAAKNRADELGLNDSDSERVANTYIRCASVLGQPMQVIVVDEDPSYETPLEEVLEIFVRVNSGGLVLYKSDLLMSLLDLTWNDIQPQLQLLVRDVNEGRPFGFTRDDVLKSLLLSVKAETRFDRLVRDRKQVEALADQMPVMVPKVKEAWERLGTILTDHCRIYSERFFRGGHNALLPFVLHLTHYPQITYENRRRFVVGIYMAIMSGIFSSAEARMGAFARNVVVGSEDFPLRELGQLIRRQYGIGSLEDLLSRHLDLTLNIAHGGITLDNNPDDLQRDHIFPRSTLEAEGYPYEKVHHYANFHFLRATDNANKSDKPPHEWFRKPGTGPPYTDRDLEERLLTWELLEPGQFEMMLEARSQGIHKKAAALFGMPGRQIDTLFE